MGTESVLIAAEKPASGTRSSLDPRYSLLLSTIRLKSKQHNACATTCSAANRVSRWPGSDGLDADRFDEHCDDLLVPEENSGELVGCYRMLRRPAPSPPEGTTPQRNSTSGRSIRYGPRWSRWAVRWCTTTTATALSSC